MAHRADRHPIYENARRGAGPLWSQTAKSAERDQPYVLTAVGNGLFACICVISIARLRLRGGHETGRLEPPSQPPTADVAHPEFGKLCLVLPGGPNVDD
jgi:hypothetical protein